MAGAASRYCGSLRRIGDLRMFQGVTAQGKGVCRAHNSSRTTKIKIRQLLREDALNMRPHNILRKDGGTDPQVDRDESMSFTAMSQSAGYKYKNNHS